MLSCIYPHAGWRYGIGGAQSHLLLRHCLDGLQSASLRHMEIRDATSFLEKPIVWENSPCTLYIYIITIKWIIGKTQLIKSLLR